MQSFLSGLCLALSVAISLFGIAFGIAGEPTVPFADLRAELLARSALLAYGAALSCFFLFLAYLLKPASSHYTRRRIPMRDHRGRFVRYSE